MLPPSRRALDYGGPLPTPCAICDPVASRNAELIVLLQKMARALHRETHGMARHVPWFRCDEGLCPAARKALLSETQPVGRL